jgi:hypothetical protein
MTSSRSTARMMGVLFLVAFFSNILAMNISGLLDPAFTEAPNLLNNVSAHSMRVKISILLDLLSSAAVIALAVSLFASLKEQNRNLALLALALWICEAVVLAASKVSVFSLLLLSEEYLQAGSPDSPYYHTLGSLFVDASQKGFLIVQFFFSLGGVLFYFLFYQSNLIPRLISGWGLVAVTLVFAEVSLDMMGHSAGLVLLVPYMFFEPFIGVWLITRGFNASDSNPIA